LAKKKLHKKLEQHKIQLLGAYGCHKKLLQEHHGIEETVLAGGYGYRQILELVQNGADAILEAHEDVTLRDEIERIHVILTDSHLYVANSGAALSEEGLEALLSSHSSPKRGNQIGRFGLGFKSLLKLACQVDIFTQDSGDIRFDPDQCRNELEKKFGVDKVPSLRLAWELPKQERIADETIRKLDWAQTIVRVKLIEETQHKQLTQEIESFPSEFLLFFPVPVSLVLDDGAGDSRALQIKFDGHLKVLHDGKKVSKWHVVSLNANIENKAAIDDATHIHARESVPVDWAVPLEGRRTESGRFWAFFPTKTPTYLPGILNAPWKLNSDRNAIIAGEWNSVLMAKAAELISETLPSLVSDDDPARLLDYFPRQIDGKDELATPLVEALWKHLACAEVIPDATGKLRLGTELLIHPRDNVELAKMWQGMAKKVERQSVVHPLCMQPPRNGRLRAFAERLQRGDATLREKRNLGQRSIESWFGCISSANLGTAKRLLKLAEAFSKECKHSEWLSICENLKIIPAENDELRTSREVIFAPPGLDYPGYTLIKPELCSDDETRRILRDTLKVKELDGEIWMQILRHAQEEDYSTFWKYLRVAPESVVKDYVSTPNWRRIKVLCLEGNWNQIFQSLFPGKIADESEVENRGILIDLNFHGCDASLLKALGISDFPSLEIVKFSACQGRFGIFEDWLSHWKENWYTQCRKQARENYLYPKDVDCPKGIHFLTSLKGAALGKLTRAYLTLLVNQPCLGNSVEFGHTKNKAYPTIKTTHPFPWLLRKHGVFLVGDSLVPVSAIVSRGRRSSLSLLSDLDLFKPVLYLMESALPPVEATASDLELLWYALIQELAVPSAIEEDSLQNLWKEAALDGVIPKALSTRSGSVPLVDVFVTGSMDLAARARKKGNTVVTLDDTTLNLWIERGARDLKRLMALKWEETMGLEDLLVSCLPDLDSVLTDEKRMSGRSLPVKGLSLAIDEDSELIACLMWEDVLYLDVEQLNGKSRADRMEVLLTELSEADWLRMTLEDALSEFANREVDRLRAEVAAGANILSRLCLAVGERKEVLTRALPPMENIHFLAGRGLQELAGLVLTQLGPSTLQNSEIASAMKEEGLSPPRKWGTPEARNFVVSVGFPEEYAASGGARRPAEEVISGPIALPPLHDFQEEVFKGVATLVEAGKGRRRAVICLPTGGGKTRVCVEAAVKLVLVPEGKCRCVLWIAQTDELCEQAVQAFRQVWVNLGAQGVDLRIVRLWGGNPNPVVQLLERPLVVVASIQTLNSRVEIEKLGWLKKPGLLVVDECHHAVTTSYSTVFNWLDMGLGKSRQVGEEPPVLGLSATPFRQDDNESRRLAMRFDNQTFPRNQEELHNRLVDRGILSRTESEALESGVDLLANELERLSRFENSQEGLAFDKLLEEINQRLAGVDSRNQSIIGRIKNGSEQSILFFANSVAHANEMSVRLNLEGISAAVISGETSPVSRRHFLARFQQGQIRVICNHSVLSTGFDAPKIDMVFIARQVFSPVRYMQMVGRGLRGEKNGGTLKCRILTVMDNLGRFKARHPYYYYEKYFSQWSGNATCDVD
jgi:superfamily II DNA or RNA helicase